MSPSLHVEEPAHHPQKASLRHDQHPLCRRHGSDGSSLHVENCQDEQLVAYMNAFMGSSIHPALPIHTGFGPFEVPRKHLRLLGHHPQSRWPEQAPPVPHVQA